MVVIIIISGQGCVQVCVVQFWFDRQFKVFSRSEQDGVSSFFNVIFYLIRFATSTRCRSMPDKLSI
jgi:hypothetical protein